MPARLGHLRPAGATRQQAHDPRMLKSRRPSLDEPSPVLFRRRLAAAAADRAPPIPPACAAATTRR